MEEAIEEKLRAIFDVCDTDGDGYITVEHLKNLAREHFSAENDEEVIGIIQLLDPEGKGKVNYQDFCQGIQQIQEVQAQLKQSTPAVTDQVKDFSFEDISPAEVQEASEASAFTYNEYDTNTDEDGQGLLIDLSTPEISRRHLPPSLMPLSENESGRSSANSRPDFTDEENYEDFGVGEDLESDTSDHNHSGSDKFSKSRRRDPASSKHHRHRGKTKSYATPREITSGSDKSDSLPPKPNASRLKHQLPNKRVSSAVYASQLQRSAINATEDILDDIDGSFHALNDRVKFLEQHVLELNEQKQTVGNSKLLLKGENSVLIKSVVDRVHTLEEQLKDIEVKSEERVKEEEKKYKELMMKHERDRGERVDYLTSRLQTFESENEKLKIEAAKLRVENDKLRMDKLECTDRYNAVQEDYNAISAEYEEMQKKYARERKVTGQLLDELGKELEELRIYKIETEHLHSPERSRSLSLSDSQGYKQMQSEIMKLRENFWVEWRSMYQSNKVLEVENEDLNAQLLSKCVRDGQDMLQEGNSLASELDHLTKEELLTAVKEQKEHNSRLTNYVDKIILAILEKNPSILEIR